MRRGYPVLKASCSVSHGESLGCEGRADDHGVARLALGGETNKRGAASDTGACSRRWLQTASGAGLKQARESFVHNPEGKCC